VARKGEVWTGVALRPAGYVDTKYYPGHPDHLKVFANPVAADEWFKENDPEGAAFEYEVLE